MAKVLVLYYSSFGHIETMAHAVAEGARAAGATADVKRVPENVPDEIAKAFYFKLDQPAPIAKVDDLPGYDAIIVATGTRYGRMSSQMANFLDQTGGLWVSGALNGKVGAVGFCWGGGVINQMAVSDPTLNAAVVYYGVPPDLGAVGKIKAALLLNYADPKLDTRLGALVPAYVEALKAAKIKFTLYDYEGANHAFNDDTQSARYNAEAAKTAWQRTLTLFKEKLT